MTPAQLRSVSPGQWFSRPTSEQRAGTATARRLDRRVLEVIVYAFDNTPLRTVVELVHAATGLATARSSFSLRVLLYSPEANSLTPRKWSGTVMHIHRLAPHALRDVLGPRADLVLPPEALADARARPGAHHGRGLRGHGRGHGRGRGHDTRDPGRLTLGDLSLYDGELVECRVAAPARAPPAVGDAPWSSQVSE